MTGVGGVVLGAVAMMALAPGGTVAKADPERARIEGIVHDYILAHPEIIPQAMQRLRDKDTAATVSTQRGRLETPFAGAWAGAKDGDVVLVEFFDYACGYCRASVKDVDRLLAEDPKLKIVFRELPILGPGSADAARASLSAAKQGKFLAFHRAMYTAGKPSAATIAEVTRKTGLDAARVAGDAKAADVSAEIEANLAMAQALQLGGTPTFVVGDQVLGGAVGYDALKEAVAKVRAAR